MVIKRKVVPLHPKFGLQIIVNSLQMNIEALISKAAGEAVKALYGMEASEKMLQLQKTRSEFEGNLTLVVFPFVKVAKKSPLIPPDQFHLTDRRHLHPGQLYLWPVAGTVRLRSIHQEAAQRHVRALYLHHLSPALLPSGPHRPASLGLSFWLRTADAQWSADVCRAMGFIPAQISGTYRKTSGT